jgi:tetratricopeptide (TPR) repeat protein
MPISLFIRCHLVLYFCALLHFPAEAVTAHFEQGVAAFEKRDWSAAREAFEAVIEKDQQISNDLLFNLGNTQFREERLGPAALWYRRALLMDPRDAAARQNLRLIQRRTGALEFPASAGSTVAALMKHRYWRWALAGAVWSGLLAIGALCFLQLRGATRAWAWAVFALAVPAAAFSAWGARSRLHPDQAEHRAIVTRAESSALAAPTETAGVIIDLPPGSEVAVREARDTWSYIEIPGDPPRVGWIRSHALSPLWPYSPELIQ